MVQQVIKKSPHGSFKVTQLCPNVVICEDIYNKQKWGNETEDKPAFMLYLGCRRNEVKGYVESLNKVYGCKWCEVRNPKYLNYFESEIKVKGMTRKNLNIIVEKEKTNLYEWWAELVTLKVDENGVPWERIVSIGLMSEEDAFRGLKIHLGEEFKDYKLIGIFPIGKDEEF